MKLELSKIKTDGGTQARAALSEDIVAEYAEAIIAGANMPPVTVFHDGKCYWLADGFHRFHAHIKARAMMIDAESYVGTKREAILYSVQANAQHGLRRTNEDKRCAVRTLLDDKEWAAWSDREIAKRCGVSAPFVGALRNPEVAARQQEHRAAAATKGVIGLHPSGTDDTKPAALSQETAARAARTKQADAGESSPAGPTPAPAKEPHKDAISPRPDDVETVDRTPPPTTGSAGEQDSAARVAELEEQLAESRENAAELADLVESYSKLDEGQQAVVKEMNRLKGQLHVVESQRNQYMTTCNELKKTVAGLRRENERLKKKVEAKA